MYKVKIKSRTRYYNTYDDEKEAVSGKNKIAWNIWDILGKLNILNSVRIQSGNYLNEQKALEKELISLLEKLKNTSPSCGNRIQKEILSNLDHIQHYKADCRHGIYVYCKSADYADEKKSSGEKEIIRFLEEHNIKYLTQYDTFKCVNPKTGRVLPYDFELVGEKILIEVQGAQHYRYIPYFHHSEDAFRMRQLLDDYKRDFANKNGYKLIEVPYTDILSGDFKNTIIKCIE